MKIPCSVKILTYKIFDTFLFLNSDGDQNIKLQ